METNDLKSYLKIDKQKIESSLKSDRGLGRLKNISNSVDFWAKNLSFNERNTGLSNFLKYRTANAFGLLKKGYDDCDITQPVIDHFRKLLLSFPDVSDVCVGKEISANEKERAFFVRKVDGKELFLETDTAVSSMYDLNLFMNIIIKKVEGLPYKCHWPDETYIKLYGLEKGKSNTNYYKPFKLFYYMQLLDRISNELVSEMECFSLLEQRAKFVHTIPNMMLVPYGYNAPRGFNLSTYKTNKKIADRLDLTIQDYEEMIEDKSFTDVDFQKRLSSNKNINTKASVDSIEFLLKHKDKLIPRIPVISDEGEKNTLDGLMVRNKAILETYYK